MIRICFSPEDSLWTGRKVPLFMTMPILPVSETVTVLSMKNSLTMSLKMITDSARTWFLPTYSEMEWARFS